MLFFLIKLKIYVVYLKHQIYFEKYSDSILLYCIIIEYNRLYYIVSIGIKLYCLNSTMVRNREPFLFEKFEVKLLCNGIIS